MKVLCRLKNKSFLPETVVCKYETPSATLVFRPSRLGREKVRNGSDYEPAQHAKCTKVTGSDDNVDLIYRYVDEELYSNRMTVVKGLQSSHIHF